MAFRRYRLRDILCIPIFLTLHLFFTLSSLILRVVEAFCSHTAFRQPAQPPRHVAVVLFSPSAGKETAQDGPRRNTEHRAVGQSVRRIVEWASEDGVSEVSIWNRDGLVEQCKEDILGDILQLPPSPPPSSPSSPTKGSSTLPKARMLGREKQTASTTYTVYAATSRPITLHLLPTSSSSIIPDITRRYLDTGRATDTITQKSLDADVKAALGFLRDPDLLIVHPISPVPFLRALLPRPPPELHGYPFWPLRITEIYHHPTPLPLPQSLRDGFTSLLGRAQMSSLPLIRKTARALPLAGMPEYRSVQGAITREVWNGALAAFSKVEQRLGK